MVKETEAPMPTAQEITDYVFRIILYYYQLKFTEISPYDRSVRFDVIALRRRNKEVRIYEVKSGRQDFTSDKKWRKYLPYCTQFAFVCPPGAIRASELPKGVGLIEVHRQGHYLKHNYVRRCKRLQKTVPDKEYIATLESIALRSRIAEKEGK